MIYDLDDIFFHSLMEKISFHWVPCSCGMLGCSHDSYSSMSYLMDTKSQFADSFFQHLPTFTGIWSSIVTCLLPKSLQ